MAKKLRTVTAEQLCWSWNVNGCYLGSIFQYSVLFFFRSDILLYCPHGVCVNCFMV